VVVAVVAVRMVEVAGDQVVGVVAMRHGFVATIRTVGVIRVVPRAVVVRGAVVGVCGAHLDRVLVDMVLVRVMEVAVMQVIDVTIVLDRGVAALGTVLVGVTFVDLMTHRRIPSSSWVLASLRQGAPAAKKSSLRVTLGRFSGAPSRGSAQAGAWAGPRRSYFLLTASRLG
jgi:hypothetical protein